MVAHVSELRIPGDAPVKAFDSSGYGERGFCTECGTHLFWKMKDDSLIHLLIGTLEDSADLTFDADLHRQQADALCVCE